MLSSTFLKFGYIFVYEKRAEHKLPEYVYTYKGFERTEQDMDM